MLSLHRSLLPINANARAYRFHSKTRCNDHNHSLKTPPSFEQVGDALMAHQRYQAAIEAYKKAPTNDPIVWNKLGIAYQLMFNLTRRDALLQDF